MKLSKRLAALAGYVPQGVVVADIGTDHGYLPIYLIEEGISPTVIAGDVKEGPLGSARKAVAEAGMEDKIHLRLGDGLAVLRPGEAEVIIIAGMGGGTIREILEQGRQVLTEVKRLILQPMVAAGQLRLWLIDHGWNIVDETLIEEDGRIYEVIAAEAGRLETQWDPVEVELGPRLLAKRHPLLETHVARLIESEEQVLKGLAKSDSDEARAKAREISWRLEKIKKVMAWR
ncbi:MAG: class I SAM-dependent methyltransferase [Clostridia bacterium]|nr:class I SAM-dependent methyltransferase [Clostridia bacterium]